jgi:translation initiation factor IF-2
VDVRLYRVIYDLVDEVKASMEGLLAPETREIRVGQAEVREVFRVSKIGFIAGCLVTEGVVRRGAKMRVVRDDVVVTDERSIESLRRVKDDVREVRAGTECGIRLAGFDDVKAGDKLVCYDVEKIKRTL